MIKKARNVAGRAKRVTKAQSKRVTNKVLPPSIVNGRANYSKNILTALPNPIKRLMPTTRICSIHGTRTYLTVALTTLASCTIKQSALVASKARSKYHYHIFLVKWFALTTNHTCRDGSHAM